MSRAFHLIALCALPLATGCHTYATKYRHAQVISFQSDYARLVQSGAITRWDSVATGKTEGIAVYVYKPGSGSIYRFDQPLTKEMELVLTRDLEPGAFILDTKGARKFIRGW